MSIISRRLISLNTKQIHSLASIHYNNVVNQNTAASSDQHKANIPPYSWTKLPSQRFFSKTLNQKECWNCKAKAKRLNHFICDECGKLQDITKEHDYFELLSLPRDFDVPSTKLTRVFRQLQTLVHPDKYGNKSEREQANSAEWSALINKAYKTLLNPLVRGQYLLKLKGEQMPNDNSTLNKEFLMEMMERNEEVDDAETEKDLRQMNDKIQEEINAEVAKLKGLFNSSDLDAAKAMLVKMKYLLSIQGSIQAKLERLTNR